MLLVLMVRPASMEFQEKLVKLHGHAQMLSLIKFIQSTYVNITLLHAVSSKLSLLLKSTIQLHSMLPTFNKDKLVSTRSKLFAVPQHSSQLMFQELNLNTLNSEIVSSAQPIQSEDTIPFPQMTPPRKLQFQLSECQEETTPSQENSVETWFQAVTSPPTMPPSKEPFSVNPEDTTKASLEERYTETQPKVTANSE